MVSPVRPSVLLLRLLRGRAIVRRRVRGVFVAFLAQPRRELLDDLQFEQGSRVGEAAGGDEDLAKGEGGFIHADSGGRYGEGESGFGEEVADEEVEGLDFFVADGQTVDYGFGAQTEDLDEVFERGLVVGVAEGEGGGCCPGRGAAVPGWWEGLGLGLVC